MIDFGDKEKFIENYQKLKSAKKMAELYNCSKTTILNYAKKINYDNSNNKERKITSIPLEEVVEYLKGIDKSVYNYGSARDL